ncbi:MAG: hypothetical protein ABIS47_12015 [Acidimicrobiales bacterium]
MTRGEQEGDDLAVDLSWPAGASSVRRQPARPAPPVDRPPARRPAPRGDLPDSLPDRRPPATARPAGATRPTPAPRPDPGAPSRRPPQPRGDGGPVDGAGPGLDQPRRPRPTGSARPDPRPSGGFPGNPAPRRSGPGGPPGRRPRPGSDSDGEEDALLGVVELLTILSKLVTGTSRASSAQIDALGTRIERIVGDLDALQLRVVRSLAGFDTVRLRVQQQLADRPPLTDDDVDRIADAVTQRLLDHVRVETEGERR